MGKLELILTIVGSVIVAAGLVFLIVFLVSKGNKKKSDSSNKAFYNEIVSLLGGIGNINDVILNSSRLSVVLNDVSLVNDQAYETFKEKGIGVVKSSKKITLVVGEYASTYYESIKKDLNK